MKTAMKYKDAVAFHGHSCPGLAIGYRAAQLAMEKLTGNRAEDEELVAIVENDACCVDAIQVLTGCTFGKGNLVYRDYGKMGFTFFNRNSGKGIRLFFEAPESADHKEYARLRELMNKAEKTEEEITEMTRIKAKRTEYILEAPAETFFKITEPLEPMPQKARIFESLRCDSCGEPMMATRAHQQDGQTLCIPCQNNAENKN